VRISDFPNSRSGAGHMKLLGRMGTLLVVVLIFGLVLPQVVLPVYIAGQLEGSLAAALGVKENVNVRLSTWPALRLLWGRFDRLQINAHRFVIDGLQVETLTINGRHLRVNPRTFVAGEQIHVLEGDRLHIDMVLTEPDLNSYVQRQLGGDGIFTVRLLEDTIRLCGRTRIFDENVEVNLDGRFEVVGSNQLAFVPTALSVQDAQVPEVLLELLADEWIFTLKLDDLPVAVDIEDIRIEDGNLHISGHHRIEV